MVRSLIAVLTFAAATPAQPRTDVHGDPLPDGAIARFGTIRDRVGSPRVLYSAALSPDGKTLAAETRQGITLWDVDSGRPALRFPWYTWQGFRPQFALDFSADGKRLARMAGRVVQVFEVKSGKVLFDRDMKEKDNVRGIAFPPRLNPPPGHV